MSCRPIGSPPFEKPHGTLTAGNPVRLSGATLRSCWPSSGVTSLMAMGSTGVVGATSTSTRSNTGWPSRRSCSIRRRASMYATALMCSPVRIRASTAGVYSSGDLAT